MRNLDQAVKDLEPWLDKQEQEREKLAGQVVRHGAVLTAITVIITAGLMASVGAIPHFLVGGGLVIAGGIAWFMRPLNRLRKDIKLELNSRVAEVFGLSYALKPNHPARVGAFRDHGLIPSWDRCNFEDHFQGEAHGAQFELYEAHLKQKRRNKNRTYYATVFRGVLVRIEFPRTIEGVTLITRDKGIFNALEGWVKKTFSGRNLDRIGLVDPSFEKYFEVYGTDQVMARYLLTPSFMERVLELESALEGKKIRCVFDEGLHAQSGQGELLLAAETGNRFEIGSMFKPLNAGDRVQALYEEIKLIESIIQTLLEPSTERMETTQNSA